MPLRSFRVALARLAGYFSPHRDAELREELEAHVAMHAAELERRGVPGNEARRAALVAAGGLTSAVEAHREQRGLPFLDRLAQDLHYGARMLGRGPLFTIVAVSAIGIAVGINAGFFTLVDAFMLQPTPVANPERLMKLMSRDARGADGIRFSYVDLENVAASARSLEGLVGYYAAPIALRTIGGGHATAGSAAAVSGNYFESLGGRPAIGRLLVPGDDDAGAAPAVVISDGLWARAFGRRADIVGRDIVVNGTHLTVVGVAAHDFRGINPLVPDLWIPFRVGERVGMTPGRLDDPANRYIVLHARVREGVSTAHASAELSSLLVDPPATAGTTAALTRRVAGWLMPNDSLIPLQGTTLLLAAPGFVVVLLVLLIACANVGNLLLSRALVRQREIAVRLAVGASRTRIIGQLLTESLLVAALGAAAGLVCARWTVTLLLQSFLAAVPTTFGNVSLSIHMSWRVFAYTAGLTAISVLAFGLAPALHATSGDVNSALKGDDALFGARIRRSRFRDALVSVQVAASLVLLTAAAILVHSLREFTDVDTGVDAHRITVARLGLAGAGHTSITLAADRLHFAARVRSLTGVRATAMAAESPFTPWPSLHVADEKSGDMTRAIQYNRVTATYFRVLGQRLLAGREFTEADSSSASVAIVSAAASQRLWPRRAAVGQRLRIDPGGDSARTVTVVGVVANARSGMVWDDPSFGYLYLPAATADLTSDDPSLLIAADGTVPDLGRPIADVAGQIDPDAPLSVTGLPQLLESQLLPYQYGAFVATGIGVLGLGLAILGLYGVVAFAVTQRRREIAIHVAMGATPRDVLGLVLRGELRLVLQGIAAGLVLALGEAKLLGVIVVPLSPIGFGTIAALAMALVCVAAVATTAPSFAALRISPMRVLRQE